MSQALSFPLKDNYSVMIWNPLTINKDAEIKVITAEYFFSVIFSVSLQTKSSHEKIRAHAVKLLGKLKGDIDAFESEIKALISINKAKKELCPFQVSAKSDSSKKIVIEDANICSDNAAFVRAFIAFDELISLLSDLETMAIINQTEYYTARKSLQSKLRGIIDGYNNLIKRFHIERKRVFGSESDVEHNSNPKALSA